VFELDGGVCFILWQRRVGVLVFGRWYGKREKGGGGMYDLLSAWPAAFEEGLFDFGLGWVFGAWGKLFKVGWC
jgi:hypothetical protein